MEKRTVNPHLRDVFQTVLKQTKATRAPANGKATTIVVNGDANVFAWGGTVHLSEKSQGAHHGRK